MQGGCIIRGNKAKGIHAKAPTKYISMKTNTIQVIVIAAIAGLLVGFASTKVTGDVVMGFAITLGYLTVAAVTAITARDYRSNLKAYSA